MQGQEKGDPCEVGECTGEKRDVLRQRERGDARGTKNRKSEEGVTSCDVVIISKPQTGSSLIPRPSYHGSLCPTE